MNTLQRLAAALAEAGTALQRAAELLADLALDAPAPAQPPRALSVAEVARLLGCSRDSVERRIREGTLRATRLGGRVLIPATEVARLLGEVARSAGR